jgi:chromate reductase, NAD(P)H dehydrogenase (quinone)
MTLNVLGIAGSLRVGSYNRALLREAASLAPEELLIETAEIGGLPLYDADVQDRGIPVEVTELARRIREADAVLIATPEYNYSIPGVLKNAVDWVSRVPQQPLNGKPAGIMGASTGLIGTARAQLHLRHVAMCMNMLVMNRPEILLTRAQDKFGADGVLVDEQTRGVVRKYLEALRDWTMMLRRPAAE